MRSKSYLRERQWSTKSDGLWADIKSLRWVIVPGTSHILTPKTTAYGSEASSLKLLLTVVLLWANWEMLSPYVARGIPNPFEPLLFISHRVPTSSAEDPRYQKGYLDLAFMAYYIIFWSFVRQSVTLYICRPVARWFGIRKEAKLDRFGEQAYAMLYFGFMGALGLVSTSSYMLVLSALMRCD